jgi:hypothetical protein
VSHRTTLTLEDDVMDRVRRESARTGRPVKDVVNDAIRAGLDRRAHRQARPFTVRPRRLAVREGVDLDDIEGLLDHLDGRARR